MGQCSNCEKSTDVLWRSTDDWEWVVCSDCALLDLSRKELELIYLERK